jgi:hypothetical protein
MTSPRWIYTRDEPTRFLAAFNSLAATKGSQTDDLHHESYFSVLSDLPIDAVERAAQDLSRVSSPFLPDAGSWYRHADALAANALSVASLALSVDSRDLSESAETEQDEVEGLRVARNAFLAKLESLSGRTLPDDSPLKTDTPRVPTFSCVTCQDLGWVREPGSTPHGRMRHCQCWTHNSTITNDRATVRLRQAQGQRPRGAGRGR